MPDELDKRIREMLASQTFEPSELEHILVEQGHPRAAVAAAIERAVADLEREKQNPAHQQQLARRKNAGRSLTAGVMVLVLGTACTFFLGWGFLQLLLVIAIGGALIAAGYRGAR